MTPAPAVRQEAFDGSENRNGGLFVFEGVMGEFAGPRARGASEAELTRVRADSSRANLALGPAEIDRLYRLAGLLLGNSADAEDATQEALLRALRSAGSLRDRTLLSAWLDRILVNICRDRLRRRRRIRFISLASDSSEHGPHEPNNDGFKEVLDRDEVLRAMSDLDPDQRIVVVLHYWAGLTLEGIAARLGWPVGTVKSRLHHALTRMRVQMTQPAPAKEGS